MKKAKIIISFLVFVILKIQAQDYLISFTGTGDTNVVETVKVKNLTSESTVTLNGGDILHLTATAGIGSPNSNYGTIHVYPNPMAEKSILTFVAPESGNAVICIIDLSGKTVYQTSVLLSPGRCNFRVSGISRGMYFVKIIGNSYSYSKKLISHGNQQSEVGIEYLSSFQHIVANPLKSSGVTIDMYYTDGDQLLFKGVSGQYSTVVPDVPTGSKTTTFNFAACKDKDNNHYAIVQIGTQWWMAENLNTGTKIPGATDMANNGIIEKYCYYNHESNCSVYGGLYQWDEMMQYVTTPGIQGICPTGWHIPTDSEWATLTTFLGGENVGGGKMKSTGTIEAGTGLWNSPNGWASNESGFTAVPAGYRYNGGSFNYIGSFGFWWSSSEGRTSGAWSRSMHYEFSNVYIGNSFKNGGFSVRCVRNF